MTNTQTGPDSTIIRWLTYMMFMMFAMTTDAVGVIIPEVMKDFDLSMTAAGMLHYGPMLAIALSGILFGFLADRLGRKKTIILGLALFSITAYLFLAGSTFAYYLGLMMISGVAIGIFKTAALALIGDISTSTTQHTSTMNGVEAFFGVGAIIGPLLVTYMLTQGVDWKWLYIFAATFCVVLIVMALLVKYPESKQVPENPITLQQTLKMLKDPYALGFSLGAFLYVATESAVYVWMPTLLLDYSGNALFLATYALTIFFVLRAAGRFLGIWMMARFNWAVVMSLFSFAILLCFIGTIILGTDAAVYLLPLSGLFMSVIYPTLNSKGISCFPKQNHGGAAGVILFFTALGAAFGPLTMGLVSDSYGGNAKYGFMVAGIFAGLLFAGLLINQLKSLTDVRLQALEKSEYS
ncbi:MFS transporter [Porticoccaceae bacterium]|nr:MFS transporter [Porticoccaceae bacterium]MDA8935787.1 MFS transporter [Porticoccaceae bacterium]MDB2319671.1 MFS transporter [Porticoccaceae bacterium]